MHFLLAVLKIIGMILGILLLLVLIILCSVLFLPVRYQVAAENEKQTQVICKGSFLWFVLRFMGVYKDKQLTFKVKLFGFSVFNYPKEEVAQKKSKQKKKEKKTEIQKRPLDIGEEDEEDASEPFREDEETEIEVKKQDEQQKQSRKPKSLFQKIRNFFEQIKEWILHFKEKLKQTIEKVKSGKEVLFAEENKEMVRHLFRELRYIFSHFRPRKVKMDVSFSTRDPARTGQVLGVLCMFPVMYHYDMHIVPDFVEENFYVKGTFFCKGRIRLIHVLIVLIRLLQDKNIRKFIKNR